jgi:hypothetical protein
MQGKGSIQSSHNSFPFNAVLFFSLTPSFLVLRDSLLRGPKCTKNQRDKDSSLSVSASLRITINTPAHTHLVASPS